MKISILTAVVAALPAVLGAANVTYGRGSPGCGKDIEDLGDERFDPKFNVTGTWRAFRTYTPPTYNKNIPMPLIMAYHGTMKTQPKLAQQSRFSNPKVNPNMVVQYMTALKKRWAGPNTTTSAADEFQFTEEALEHLMNNYCIDVDRVYLVGHSGGAGFANMLACNPKYSYHFAGMALMGATLYHDLDDEFCKNAHVPLPIWELHGTVDGTSPYWGDAHRKVGAIPAIPDWVRRWVRRNDCDPVPRESQLVNKEILSHKYTCQGRFGFVEHIKVIGRDYNWMTDTSAMEIGPIIMSFLQQHIRPGNLKIPMLKNGKFSASGNSTGFTMTGFGNSTSAGNYTGSGGHSGPRGPVNIGGARDVPYANISYVNSSQVTNGYASPVSPTQASHTSSETEVQACN